MENTGTVHVTETANENLPAIGAHLRLDITGSRFAMGAAVFSEVPEVRALLEAMQACGIRVDQITIESARIDGEKGMISRSTTATYEASVHCSEIARLPAVFEALASLKRVRLHFISWIYGTSDDAIEACVERASLRAVLIAEGLGASVEGVESVREVRGAGSSVSVEVIDDSLIGLTLAPSSTRTTELEIVFRISTLK